ncbi:hypothetical protein [Haloarcula marina]|uniref:hypothetical protein n=1 Tax=Haloarcula marina TaxID=2961574 RepID=UPI0020B81058|nr:hypothetical protein [Halomicroarcula marina]
MQTLQTRLLTVTVGAMLAVLAGDLLGSTPLETAGFVGATLALAALFVAMTSSLFAGLARQPDSPLVADRPRR